VKLERVILNMLNNQNITPLMKRAQDQCKIAQMQFEIIPLPDDLPLDVASHIKFHGITMSEAIPTLIFKTEKGFIAVQKRTDTKINSSKLKKLAGVNNLNFASPEDLKELGVEIGIVPLTGLSFPHYIDEKVLEVPVVYGGNGSKSYALKLNSRDLVEVNKAIIGDFTEHI